MKFRAIVQLASKTATGVQVPDAIVDKLGSKRPAVRVTINGHTYRSSVASMGGKLMLGISAENRKSAGVSAGDDIEVELELDTEPREVTVPADLTEALAQAPEARQRFEKLPYSHKLRHVLAIDAAKTTETRKRRIAGAIQILLENKR